MNFQIGDKVCVYAAQGLWTVTGTMQMTDGTTHYTVQQLSMIMTLHPTFFI